MMHRPVVYLYTPASSYSRLGSALNRGADVVIYDLEDAVASSEKVAARESLQKFLESLPSGRGRPQIHVRINAIESEWGMRDLAAIADLKAVSGVRIPKVNSPEVIENVASSVPHLSLHALIEDSRGVQALRDICAAPSVAGVSLGDNDLRAAFHLRGEKLLDDIRGQLVIALAAAGKPPPTGSVFPVLNDPDALYKTSVQLRDMGFSGRTCIHPSQIEPIRKAFLPSDAEIQHAREVLTAAYGAEVEGAGAVALADGSFVDAPFVADAQYVLSLAGDGSSSAR